MRIALCDDEAITNIETENLIRNLLKDLSENEIVTCLSGEELLEKHERNKFDIIFLDIEMGGINGMDTARKIRETDDRTIIVFLTSYNEFATEGYEVNAYRYLVKNQPAYVYEKHFKSIFEEYSQKHRCFGLCDRNRQTCIPLNEICFFEVTNKKITLHTVNKTFEYVGKLSDVEERLKNDSLFIKTHKSYIINISQVDMIDKFDILMKNNKKVMLSRNLKKNVIDKYISYMTGR